VHKDRHYDLMQLYTKKLIQVISGW